jgi:hypothetical protein
LGESQTQDIDIAAFDKIRVSPCIIGINTYLFPTPPGQEDERDGTTGYIAEIIPGFQEVFKIETVKTRTVI